MGRGTLMIRMIDIVFILLFGFIAVSQISSAKAIDPPKSEEANEGTPEGTRIVVVGVQEDGSYPIDSGEIVFTKARELQDYLTTAVQEAHTNGELVGVRIRAHWNSPIEYSLAVAKMCRDLGIPKGFDVVRVTSD